MLARVVIHVLARVVIHVLAHVLLHVLAPLSTILARVVLHVLARLLLHVLAGGGQRSGGGIKKREQLPGFLNVTNHHLFETLLLGF